MILTIIYFAIGLIGGYALGSIPFGLVFTKLAGLPDIRATGSGNIGATNVLRTGRKDLALLTLICDSGKGALAVLIFGAIAPMAAIGAALGSVLGHLFPIWLNFRGGKGVATILGVLLALMPFVGIITCALWLASAFLFRMSSLAALIAVSIAPFFAGVIYGSLHAFVTVILATLVVYKHRDNITRIINKSEPKIGEKKVS
jgi:glycerol-3-phosphate acyltransferase PlsY